MSTDFDLTDFYAARRDPRRFMHKLKKFIREGERGYHAALRDRVAGLLAMTYAARADFALFDEWRQADCFADNIRVLSLVEEDFRPYAARCVVALGCVDSDVLPSTRSKCTTIVKHLITKKVEPEECADYIKAEGGFEAMYRKAKKKRVQRMARAGGRADDEPARGGTEPPAGKPKQSSGAGSARAGASDAHGHQLWIDLDEDDLDDFLSNAEEGEIRTTQPLLAVPFDGRRGPEVVAGHRHGDFRRPAWPVAAALHLHVRGPPAAPRAAGR